MLGIALVLLISQLVIAPRTPAAAQVGLPEEGASGQIRGVGGLCLDLPFNNIDAGTKLWMWPCNTGWGQQWTFTAGEFRVSGQCLDIESTEQQGAFAQIEGCGSTSDLDWYMTDTGEIRSQSLPGLCLDVQSAGTTQRTPVWMFACNGTPAQQWEFPTGAGTSGAYDGFPAEGASGQIRSFGGRCLDLPFNNTDDGTELWIWRCNTGLGQQWTYNEGQFQVRGTCLDIGGTGQQEALAQIGACGTTGDLDWYMTAANEIRTERFAGLCLEVQFGGTASRTPVWLNDCDGSLAQKWLFPSDDGSPTNALRVTSTCLAGNGRIDVNVVNTTDQAASYELRIGSLSPRRRTVEPRDWWRSPVTGRPDGLIDVTVARDGVGVLNQTIDVRCDANHTASQPEVHFLTWCDGGRGRIATQIANSTAAPKAYILDVGGLRRSTTAPAWGAAFRGVSGRPDGSYAVSVESAGVFVRTSTIEVSCS